VIACNFIGTGEVQVNRPCEDLPVLVQAAIVKVLTPEEKGDLGKSLRRGTSPTILQVAAFSNLVAGDTVTIDNGDATQYEITGRYFDGQNSYLGLEPSLGSTVGEGTRLSAELSSPFVRRYNMNKNGFLNVDSESPTEHPDSTPNSASSLFVGYVFFFLALFLL